MSRSPLSNVLGLAAWIGLALVAATVGAVGSLDASAFYGTLDRPAWAPPAWLFGPVWTLLYLAMGVAAWLVWKQRGLAGAGIALGLFVVQLAFNALWSWLFFAWRQGALALADIALLWLLVAGTIAAFWRVRPLAAALLVPYLGWITFAGALNYAILQRNPAALG